MHFVHVRIHMLVHAGMCTVTSLCNLEHGRKTHVEHDLKQVILHISFFNYMSWTCYVKRVSLSMRCVVFRLDCMHMKPSMPM